MFLLYFCWTIHPLCLCVFMPDPVAGSVQTVRLKIQTDQNVNDPAVKAAILEKVSPMLHDRLQFSK